MYIQISIDCTIIVGKMNRCDYLSRLTYFMKSFCSTEKLKTIFMHKSIKMKTFFYKQTEHYTWKIVFSADATVFGFLPKIMLVNNMHSSINYILERCIYNFSNIDFTRVHNRYFTVLLMDYLVTTDTYQ